MMFFLKSVFTFDANWSICSVYIPIKSITKIFLCIELFGFFKGPLSQDGSNVIFGSSYGYVIYVTLSVGTRGQERAFRW